MYLAITALIQHLVSPRFSTYSPIFRRKQNKSIGSHQFIFLGQKGVMFVVIMEDIYGLARKNFPGILQPKAFLLFKPLGNQH